MDGHDMRERGWSAVPAIGSLVAFEDGAECPVLGGSRSFSFDGEVLQKCLYSVRAQVFGVALVVEEDEAFDPICVALFGTHGVVPGAKDIAGLIE